VDYLLASDDTDHRLLAAAQSAAVPISALRPVPALLTVIVVLSHNGHKNSHEC